MMSTMTPMMTHSEAPACPPALPVPRTAAEAFAAVVVVLPMGGRTVVFVVSSIGGLAGGFLVVGFLVVGFGSDSEVDEIFQGVGLDLCSHEYSRLHSCIVRKCLSKQPTKIDLNQIC